MKTIDDIIHEYMDDEITIYDVSDYLDNLPLTGDSAYALLDATDTFDMPEIYEKLLTDFADILSVEETQMLKEKFLSTFDLPLPGEN